MRAVIANKPEANDLVLELVTDRPLPALQPSEILIKIAASPLNPSDLLNVKGNFSSTLFPRVPGRDFAGIVVAPETSPLYGKKVFGTSGYALGFTRDGAHAEHLVVSQDAVTIVPSNLDLKQASVLGVPWTTAQLALIKAEPKKGETVMVVGAGGSVGSAAVQLAKSSYWSCKVITVGRGERYDVDSQGDKQLSRAAELTDGQGPDVIIDTVGDFDLIQSALGQLRKGGRLAVITTGASSGSAKTSLEVDIKTLYRQEQSIRGCNSVGHPANEMAGWLRDIAKGFERGELKAQTSVRTQTFPSNKWSMHTRR